MHRHPCEETIQEEEARFTIEEETIEAVAGEIVVIPAETAHGFVNTGTTPLRQVNIHPVPRMQTEWLK